MQPFDYDLQCPAPKDNSITHAAAEPSNLDAAAPHTHKQGTLHRRLQPLSTEKTQGFVLRLSPQAITMRFGASRVKPACIYAHGNTR